MIEVMSISREIHFRMTESESNELCRLILEITRKASVCSQCLNSECRNEVLENLHQAKTDFNIFVVIMTEKYSE